MSLMQFGPSATQAPSAPQPVQPTQVTPVVVDNQVRPVSHLRGYVEGMRAVVHYYSQVTNSTLATYGHDTGKSQALQQYRKINRMEVILDGDLSQEQDQDTKAFVIKGTAFVTTASLVPNAGDLFSMDVGDGRVGIMQVNNSQRMTAMNETVYQIEFTHLFYASDERFADLESKVVQQLHYIRDYAQFGKDPVVTESVFVDLKALSKIKVSLINDYLRSFTSREHKLLMMVGQPELTHDLYCAAAFRRIVNTRLHPEVENLRFLNNGIDDHHDQATLWDALFERRADLLIGCRDRSYAIASTSFRPAAVLRSLRYCGAQKIVFPYSRAIDRLESFYGISMPWTPTVTFSPGGDLSAMVRAGEPSALAATLPPLHPVSQGGFYILSEAFYTNQVAGQSLLEKLVWDYLQGEGISSRDLHYLVSNHRAWSAEQRYFYVPILLILIQAALMDAG